MPIIPRYNLTQTSTHVSIEVSIPQVRVSTSTLDLVIDHGIQLHLYAPPVYLLKLTLPDRVVDEALVEKSLARAATASGLVCVVAADDNGTVTKNTTFTKEDLPTFTKEDLPKLQYNPEKMELVILLRKEQEKYWPDLDFLGKLQQPSAQQQRNEKAATKRTVKPLVKVLDAGYKEVELNQEKHGHDTSQTGNIKDLLSINQESPTYGLFQNHSNVFRDYARAGLAQEMLECPNPDEICACENGRGENLNRRNMRLEIENAKFDPVRYLNDSYIEEEEDMIYDAAMALRPHWRVLQSAEKSLENITNELTRFGISTFENQAANQTAFFTPEESHLLATLPSQVNNNAKLSAEQRRTLLLSLTDVLFAYAYDHRTTGAEPTVESSWTVMILSPSLSWLENYNSPYDTLEEVLQWSLRRSLIYPYLRSYTLARKVVDDVSLIVKGGRRIVIRCLLQLHRVMEKSESHYLFNKLYIDPLIGWMQQAEENEVQLFGREIERLLMGSDLLRKQCLNLNLIELEKSLIECHDDEKSTLPEEQ